MSTRYDELKNILGTGSVGTPSSTPEVEEQKQTSRRDELYSLLGESTAPSPDTAASYANTAHRDAVLETQTQGAVVPPSVSSADSSPQGGASAAMPQSAAPTAPLTQGSLAGEGRSAEQIQQEISDSRKRLEQLQLEAAYILTVEPGAELGRQMDEERARIKALNKELDALKAPSTNEERDSLIQRMNAITENEGYATTVELADAVTQEKQDTRQRLHQLDEELGNAARFYDSGERAGAVAKGALKQTGSAYTNFMGTLQGLGNRLHESSSTADQAVAGSDYAGWATDELTAANMAEAIIKENPDGNYLERLQKEEQRLYEKADTVAASAAKDIAQAKEGLSALGQAGVDISVAIIQNGIDAVAKKSGLGMLPFFVRAAGGSMQEARHAGASTGQQLAYGLPKAAIEVATELLSGGIAGTGTSGLDDVVEPLINKLSKSTAGRIALNAIYDASMEGTEEVISDLLDPFVKLVYNDQALKEAWENRADVGAQMLYDYLIGAVVGSIGSGTKILTGAATDEVVTGKPVKTGAVTGQYAEKNAALAGMETQATEQAENPTAQTQEKSYPTVEELIQPIRPAGNAGAEAFAPAAGGNAPVNAGVQATAQGQAVGQQVMTQEERAQKEADWYANREKEAEKAYEDAKKRYEEALNGGNADETDFLSSPEMRKVLMDMAKKDLEDVRNRKIPSPFSNAEAQVAGTADVGESPQPETPQSTPARPVMDTAENLTGIPGPVQRKGQGNNAPLQQNIDNGETTAYNNNRITNGGAEDGIRTAGLQQDDAGRSAEANRRGIPGVYQYSNSDNSGWGRSGEVPVGTGFVLISENARKRLNERGVAVVEARDASSDKAAFSSALESARANNPDNGWAVTPKSAEELEQSGARLLMDERGSAGLAVTPDGDIEAVFANHAAGAPKGATKSLIPMAIANGGAKLDCYGVDLVRLYAQYGFTPVARVKFDPEYANPGWDSSKGTPDIYFLMHNGDSADSVVDKIGTYPIPTAEELQALPEMDYDSAYAYRDRLLAEEPLREAQTHATEAAQNAQRAAQQAETPPTTQNATQTASGELNTQTETNTQEQAENAEADEADELPVRAAFTPMVSPDSAVQTERTGEENGIGGEIPKGAKISQFWSNTLQKVEEYARVPEEGKTPPLWYMPKSEAQSLAEAASRLKEDRQGTIQDLVSSDAWSGVQLDSAASIASELYADAMKSGNWEPVAAWDKVMANHSRESARGIQAIAKYSRTGTGIAADVISKLQDSSLSPEKKKAVQKVVGKFGAEIDAAIAEKSVGRIRNVILKMNEHRGTGTFFKDNFEKVMKKIQDVDYLSEYARRQLYAVGSDYTVSETRSFGDMLKTWQVNAQLTSLGTFFRNIGGNLSFGAIDSVSQNGFALALDHLVSKKTGKRTVAADIGWFSSDTRMRASDALYKSIVEVAGDVDMGGSATRYGITSGRTFKMSGGKAERFMSRWEQLLSYSLRTSDQVFRGRIEGATQSGLERIKNSGLSAEEISQIAENTADYRLFQNEGTAAKISKGAHDVLNLIGIGGQVNGVTRQGGFGIGDLVNPYPKVPANLAVKALEYSPANIIKGGIELAKLFKNVNAAKSTALNQHQAVMDIARGMTGVPIIALCAALFKTGLVKNFDDEEDYDVMAQNAAEGKTGVQINLDAALRAFNGESAEWKDGDDLMSISWAEPINAFLAIGALIANEDDDATIGTYIGDYFDGALQSVLDMPLMSNLSGAIDTVRYSTAESLGGQIAEGALDYAASTATGFIPAPIRQAARASDPYYRNTKGDSALETAWNNLANVIPGLRQLALDVKTDNFGQPKENAGGFAQRALNALVLPGAINKLNQSDASAAVEAIYEATGDAAVYPDRKAPNSISSGKNKHSLTADEKQNYQAEAGQTSGKLISSLAESKYYDRMSDEQKAEVVKAINLYAEHKAADQIFDILGIDTKRDKWETLKGNDLISYLSVKELVSGMYDDDGKITDYSAADKLIGQIKSGYGNLSTEAKGILKSSYGMLDDLIYGQENGVGTKEIYTAKEKADVNGNGSITQEELWNYLETQVIMPSSKKSVLWDILTSGKTGYSEYAEKQK